MSAKTRTIWTFAITSVAVFMATLDNLVVTTALPVIRKDLHATIQSLEWTVNAYTLTFAVLLLTGAALGDRFGRRRMLVIGLALIPMAQLRLPETYGPANRLDLPGLALASAGLFGIVWGLVRGNAQGWASTEIVSSLTVGAIVVVAFVLWELRAEAPMLPMRFF